jgi:hypothetical protein
MSFTETRTSWQPESYAEMGAAVPFTTPELTAARARNTGRGLELTLPNPSGRRGIYILDPRELGRYCQATLHDRRLTTVMGALPVLTPSTVREAARQVAACGFAGRAAAAGVRAAREADRKAELAMQLGLVRLLVRQVAGSDAAAQEMPAKVAIDAVAARSGQSFTAVKGAIETVSVLMAPAGLPGLPQARHPALLTRLEAALTQADGVAGQDLGRATQAAALIASVGREILTLAQRAMAMAARMMEAMPTLLNAMLTNPGAPAALMTRLDWLLDGWAAVELILRYAPPGRICAALNEAAVWVPAVPVETCGWFGAAADGIGGNETARQNRRAEVLAYSDWRTGGLALELVPRNEAFRALAA